MCRTFIFCFGTMFFIQMDTKADAQCKFPADLRGSWISADKGVLTFTDNKLSGYSIQLSRTFSSVDFECKTLSNNQYYLRGTSTFDVFSNIYRPHICLEFYNLTSDKYYYHVATDIQSTINDRIYIDKDVNLVTHGEVCNRQPPFEEKSYVMLIKDGASDTSLAVECPNDISRNFDNVKFSSSDGNYSCSGTLDIFTDRLKMNYTYNSCENRLTFSDDGVWRCLYNIHVDSTTYLAALNTDAVLVTGQTYRIVCYALKWQGNTLKSTLFPGSCRLNQNASNVVTPGVYVSLSDISGPTDTLVTENTTENTTQGPTDPPVTDNSQANTTQDYGLDMITLVAVNVTIESKKHPGLRLDDDSRVEVGLYSPKRNLNFCSSGWDDYDATVFCKSFNRTWIGQAIAVEKLRDVPIFPYSFDCCGLEPNLFACNMTEDEHICNTTKVAGAMCYLGSGKAGKCVTNHNQELSTVESGSPFSGVSVGISVAFVVVVCVIIVVVIIRRRSVNIYHKEDKESLKREGEEIKRQETSFNAYTNGAPRLSDHTYDLFESDKLKCCSLDSNLQKETKASFTNKKEQSIYQKTGFDEFTNNEPRLSDHTYELLEISGYNKMTNVSVPPAK